MLPEKRVESGLLRGLHCRSRDFVRVGGIDGGRDGDKFGEGVRLAFVRNEFHLQAGLLEIRVEPDVRFQWRNIGWQENANGFTHLGFAVASLRDRRKPAAIAVELNAVDGNRAQCGVENDWGAC